MRRRRSTGNPISLFSLLDVLVNTMGALILLLILVSRHADLARQRELADQQAKDQSSSAEVVPELPPLPPALVFANAEPLPPWQEPMAPPPLPPTVVPRAGDRDEQERLRNALTTIEQRLQDAEHVRAELERQVAEINRDRVPRPDQPPSLDPNIRQLADAEQQLAVLKHQLEEKRAEHKALAHRKNETAAYTLTPYIGGQGTQRQPIYLECLSDKIILQPDGVELTPDLLTDPARPDNPLATLVRTLAARGYGKNQDDPQKAPYPLLIVRPNGIEAYYLAVRALATYEGDFGYELVPDEAKLAYPTPEAERRELAESVVSAARRQADAERAMYLGQLGDSKDGDDKRLAAQGEVGQAAQRYLAAYDRRYRTGLNQAGHAGIGMQEPTPRGVGSAGDETGSTGPSNEQPNVARVSQGIVKRVGPNASGGLLSPRAGSEVLAGTRARHHAAEFSGTGDHQVELAGDSATPGEETRIDESLAMRSLPLTAPAGYLRGTRGSGNNATEDRVTSTSPIGDFRQSGDNAQHRGTDRSLAPNAGQQASTDGGSEADACPAPPSASPPAGPANSPTTFADVANRQFQPVLSPTPDQQPTPAAQAHRLASRDNLRRTLANPNFGPRVDAFRHVVPKRLPVRLSPAELVLPDGSRLRYTPSDNPNRAADAIVEAAVNQMKSWGSPGNRRVWKPIIVIETSVGLRSQAELLASALPTADLEVEIVDLPGR